MHLSETVRRARTRSDLTQQDIAAGLGLANAQLVSNCERGVASLSPRHFRKLSRMTRTPLNAFINAAVRDYRDSLRTRVRKGRNAW